MNRDNFGSDRAAATYYDNIDFTGTKVLRTDPAINFNWGGGSPEPTMGVDYFSVRWEGQIVPRYSETYTFYAGSDDGVRLWINGQLIVDNWWDRGHTEGTGTINLVLGQSYDIRMEYYEKGGGASATLAWSSARQAKEIVPQSYLFVPSEGGNYRTSALNQYTSVGGQTLGYDGRFNLTGYAGATFTYDAQNRLVSASKGGKTVQFTYDGLGRCLKRTTNGAVILFAYDGWKPLAEWSELASRDIDGKAERPSERARTSQWAGDGAWWAYRIYGPGADEVLWSYDSRVGSMRMHSDVHGNVIALLDYSGNQIEKYSYDAFGTPKIMDPAGNQREKSQYGNRFLFQGREWIPELGIYDYRNRMYHPGIGRFLQTDPIGFDAGDMNLFRYCGDDPVNRSDPLGLEGEIFGRGELELAVDVARRQVEAASLDPNRKSAIAWIIRKGERFPRPTRYYPSKMVPILAHGKGYKVGPTIDGVTVTRGGQTRELESAPPELGRVVLPVHGHNDKRGRNTKTPGLAVPGWSDRDLKLPDVDRMDESNFGKWYSRRNGKEVPSDGASRYKSTSDAGSSPHNAVTGSYTDTTPAPSAADIDLGHQATGVPSLGAESVNFAPGPR